MAEYQLDLNDIGRLRAVFKKNDWSKNTNEETVFINFCKLLSNLPKEHKELIFDLTEKYLWVPSNEYESKFNLLLNKIDEEVLKKCKTIYLFPIIKIKDEGEFKSGNHCIYLFKTLFLFNPRYQEIKIEIIPNFYKLKTKEFKKDGSDLIFFIDDFIGSGLTFNSTWTEAVKNPTFNKGYIYILSLVIQNEAIKFINGNFDKHPLYIFSKGKGIEEEYVGEEKLRKIKLMKEIEKIIKPKSYRFGFNQSEALVTMMRTPNNTFPVFWMNYKIKEEKFIPPFPRF